MRADNGPRPKVKVRRVKPPAGDVASSGGNYGIPQAKRAAKTKTYVRAVRKTYDEQPIPQRQRIVRNATGPVAAAVVPIHKARVARNQQLKRSAAQHDVASGMAEAQAYLAAHPEILHPSHPHHGGLLGDALSAIGNNIAAAAFPGVKAAGQAVDAAFGTHLVAGGEKAIRNVPSDAAELATGTPSSVAKLASTAVHHPEQVPGMLLEPYKQLAEHPGKFITEHPVTTALMVDPAIKMPGRVLGKAARLAGKQTLEREAATLPGTALRQQRTASRDIAVNALQKRRDAKAGPQVMSDAEIQRRVDEFYAAGQKHKMRVQAAATRQAKALPKDQRAEHITGALGGAEQQLNQRFVKEFGATHYRAPSGAIVKPKNATEGVLHASQADAQAIAKRVPFDAVVRKVGDQYAVLPRVAAERLRRHKAVGTSPAIGARVLRSTRTAFTSTVLPLSPKWLTGNTVEAALRSLISGSGPTSYLRARKVLGELERQTPGAGRALEDRAAGGGYFGGTIKSLPRKTLADEFAGSKLANVGRALTKVGAQHGPKEVHQLWRHVTDFVFNSVNGRIEHTAQTAMLGKALKNSPLMERSILGLSDKAIADAAKGLKGTEAQVALGRAVDRMYGRYAKFSPAVREAIMHWTPFAPWYGNVVTFLTKVLPVDHPVHAALLADVNAATEQWRKAAGLSLRGGRTVPSFLLGSYPTGKGFLRLGRYTPFGASGDPTQAVGDLFMPQLLPALENLKGIDWKGKPLKHPDGKPYNQGEKALAAAITLIENMVPAVAQTDRITHNPGDIGAKLNKEFNPFQPTTSKTRVRKKTTNSGWGGSSGWDTPASGWGGSSSSGWDTPTTDNSGWG